jgi:dihydroorotase
MPVALEGLAEVFDRSGARARLADFVAGFGADFYDLPRTTETITLVRAPWTVPAIVDGVVPYRAGETLAWRISD